MVRLSQEALDINRRGIPHDCTGCDKMLCTVRSYNNAAEALAKKTGFEAIPTDYLPGKVITRSEALASDAGPEFDAYLDSSIDLDELTQRCHSGFEEYDDSVHTFICGAE
jgi:hypothetical protein